MPMKLPPLAVQSKREMLLLALIATAAFAGEPLGADMLFQAPNMVPLSPRLVTSGQSTADALSRLASPPKQAFEHLLQR